MREAWEHWAYKKPTPKYAAHRRPHRSHYDNVARRATWRKRDQGWDRPTENQLREWYGGLGNARLEGIIKYVASRGRLPHNFDARLAREPAKHSPPRAEHGDDDLERSTRPRGSKDQSRGKRDHQERDRPQFLRSLPEVLAAAQSSADEERDRRTGPRGADDQSDLSCGPTDSSREGNQNAGPPPMEISHEAPTSEPEVLYDRTPSL